MIEPAAGGRGGVTYPFAGVAVAPLVGLDQTKLDRLTTGQIASLLPPHVAALTAAQFAGLAAEKVAAFSIDQCRAWRPEHLLALTPLQVAAIPAGQLAAFTSEQRIVIFRERFPSAAQLGQLTPIEVSRLPAANFALMGALEGAALTEAQAREINREQVRQVPPLALAAFRPSVFAQLSSLECTTKLLRPQVEAITAGQAAAFTPDAFRWQNEQWGWFSAAAFASIPPECIAILSEAAVASLTETQTGAMLHAQFAQLPHLPHLTPLAFAALDPQRCVANFADTHVQNITAAQAASLTGEQFAVFTPAKLIQLTRAAFAALNAAHFAGLSVEKANAITADQAAGMSIHQVPLLGVPQFAVLRPEAFASLPPELFPHFTVAQLRAITPTQSGVMTALQVNALTPLRRRELASPVVRAIPGTSIDTLATAAWHVAHTAPANLATTDHVLRITAAGGFAWFNVSWGVPGISLHVHVQRSGGRPPIPIVNHGQHKVRRIGDHVGSETVTITDGVLRARLEALIPPYPPGRVYHR